MQDIEAFRFVTVQTPDDSLDIALHAFFRRIKLAHVLDEGITPLLRDGNGLVTMAIRDRPWPPFGPGAQTISALTVFHPVSEDTAGLGNVFLVDEELTSMGLMMAVYREGLDQLTERGIQLVHWVVRENAPLSTRVLLECGFAVTDLPYVTDGARYWIYEAPIEGHLEALGFRDRTPLQLLAGDVDADRFDRAALYLTTINLSFLPYWADRVRDPEVIPNLGPGQVAACAPPGGTRPIAEENI